LAVRDVTRGSAAVCHRVDLECPHKENALRSAGSEQLTKQMRRGRNAEFDKLFLASQVGTGAERDLPPAASLAGRDSERPFLQVMATFIAKPGCSCGWDPRAG
jgi:hypothetical protein